MIILAMDTSSVNATVAVCNEHKLLGEYTISCDRAHSQIIMPLMDEMLKRCGVSVCDIDVFAVALGPGSFTGLRIGIAAIKTLAQTLSKKLIGVSSLDCIASSFFANEKYVCPLIDARRNEAYNAIYYNGEKIVSDRVGDVDEILNELLDKQVVFAGDGLIRYREKIEKYNNKNWHIAPVNVSMQKASGVAAVALKRALENDFDEPENVLPIYLRLSQAEREYNLAHGIN